MPYLFLPVKAAEAKGKTLPPFDGINILEALSASGTALESRLLGFQRHSLAHRPALHPLLEGDPRPEAHSSQRSRRRTPPSPRSAVLFTDPRPQRPLWRPSGAIWSSTISSPLSSLRTRATPGSSFLLAPPPDHRLGQPCYVPAQGGIQAVRYDRLGPLRHCGALPRRSRSGHQGRALLAPPQRLPLSCILRFSF